MDPDIFSPDFRTTSFYENLPSLLKRSANLRQCLADFEELGGTISLGRAGLGSYCQGVNIVIDPARLDCTSDESLAITLSHEIGHARGDSRTRTTGVTSLYEHVNLLLMDEGIAVTTEHKTAVELDYRKPGGMYDELEKVSTDDERIQVGSDLYRKAHPSGSPLLNYEQKYSLNFALSSSNLSIPKGYMQGITADEFSITKTEGGGFIFEIPKGADVVVRDGKDGFKTQHYFRAEFDSKRKLVGQIVSESSPLSNEAAEKRFAEKKGVFQDSRGLVSSTKEYHGPISEELQQHPLGKMLARLAEDSPTLTKCLEDLDRLKGQVFVHAMPQNFGGYDVFLDPKRLEGLTGEQFALEVAYEIDKARRYLPASEKSLHSREWILDSHAYAACTEFRVSRELGVPMRDQDLQTRLELSEGHRTEAAKKYVRNSRSPVSPDLTKEEFNHVLAALDTAKIILPPGVCNNLKSGEIKIREYPDGGFDLTVPPELGGKIQVGSEWKEMNGFEGSFAPNGLPRERPSLKERLFQMEREFSDKVEAKALRLSEWLQDKVYTLTGADRAAAIDHWLNDHFNNNPNLSDIAESYKERVVHADEKRELALQMNQNPVTADKVRSSAVLEAQETAKSEIRLRLDSLSRTGAPEKSELAQKATSVQQ